MSVTNIEYGQRLRIGRRGMLRDDAGSTARRLLACGTIGGAASLGVHAGRIEVGAPVDLIAVDLDDAALVDATPESLPEWLVFSGGAGLVREVCVGGRWRRPASSSSKPLPL